jgi:endonuclease-3 related protein
MRFYQLYLKLKSKYKKLDRYWSLWCKSKKSWKEKEKIAIGAILVQRTSWKNVELALYNLEKQNILSIKAIYRTGKKNFKLLEKLIRPSGFYKQKAKRLLGFCKFIVEEHNTLKKFLKQDIDKSREQLLNLFGIGPETADSILLYAGEKPVFVIDEYTRRWVKKHRLTTKFSYDHLQKLFEKDLPRDYKIYQNFHAMIVLEGQNYLKKSNKRSFNR